MTQKYLYMFIYLQRHLSEIIKSKKNNWTTTRQHCWNVFQISNEQEVKKKAKRNEKNFWNIYFFCCCFFLNRCRRRRRWLDGWMDEWLILMVSLFVCSLYNYKTAHSICCCLILIVLMEPTDWMSRANRDSNKE